MQRCYYNLEILTPLGLNKKKNLHPEVRLNASAKIRYSTKLYKKNVHKGNIPLCTLV